MQRHKQLTGAYAGPDDYVTVGLMPMDASSTRRRRSRRRASTSGPPTGCSSTASSASRPTASAFKTVNPATEELLAEVTEAGPGDVDARRGRCPAGLRGVVGPDAPARSGRSTCSGSPGSSRSAPASWRCSRRLDNGKPIKESRDVDVPLAAAHFFYYAGWADKLAHAGFGPAPRPSASPGRSSRGTSRC